MQDECGDWVTTLCPYGEMGCPDNMGDYDIVMPTGSEAGAVYKVGYKFRRSHRDFAPPPPSFHKKARSTFFVYRGGGVGGFEHSSIPEEAAHTRGYIFRLTAGDIDIFRWDVVHACC